jgi:6-pyruvoyltetrahydropterin/6-carboxytetrahydropterin synthase
MHKLCRAVRFSINPFLTGDTEGYNSYASRPAGEGLAIFFELSVCLSGEVEPDTGFIVNVTEIDRAVREYVVPIFSRRLREDFGRGRHTGLGGVAELLKQSRQQLSSKFDSARVVQLGLKLNPFRKVEIGKEDFEVVYFSEKFEFAATHKLWNDKFSEERNFEVFGKCASKAGHGHNYIVEVTIETKPGGFHIGDYERVVTNELIELIDHKNLNVEVEEFSQVIPTVENLSVFAWERLAGKFGQGRLHCVTVWETDKTCCSYFGSG